MQRMLSPENGYRQLDAWLHETQARRLLVVCDAALPYLAVNDYFDALESRLGITVERFSGFEPNPQYASVEAGVEKFRAARCDAIAAVGGGSAIDVAKCIKLYAGMDPGVCYLAQKPVPNGIPLLAMPTTAGTGSEATRFAVVYYKGEKQSVADDSILPGTVLLDPTALKTLPPYQRKATMLDALCHAIESFWSVHSTRESRALSAQALRLILENREGYLANNDAANAAMQRAAYTAGQAINITQTTAGHAMCYKLTSLYGIAHGHAAALCVAELWPYMLAHLEDCIDPRGEGYLQGVFEELARSFGCTRAEQAAQRFVDLVRGLALPGLTAKMEDIDTLTATVNPVRLKNNPVRLDTAAIRQLYEAILNAKRQENR